MNRQKSFPVVLLLGLITLGCGAADGAGQYVRVGNGGPSQTGTTNPTPGQDGIPVGGTATSGSTTATTGGSGTSGSTTTGGTGSTATSGTGSTATATSGTTTGGSTSDSLAPITNTNNVVTGLLPSGNSPTSMVVLGNTTSTNTTPYLLVAEGFGLGLNQGSLEVVNTSTAGGTPITLSASSNSGIPALLSNPVGMVAYGNGVLVTDGFGITGQGRVVYVANISTTTGVADWYDVTTNASPVPHDLVGITTVGSTAYVSEYDASGQGDVLQIDLSGVTTGTVSQFTVSGGLAFPAGLASDGTYLYVCVNGPNSVGGATGGVLQIPLSVTTPYTPTTQQALQPSGGTFVQPYSCAVDGLGGLVVAGGFGLTLNSSGQSFGLAPAGVGQGAIWYMPAGQAASPPIAYSLADGLTNCAGIAVVNSTISGQEGAGFVQSVASSGSASQITFQASNPPTLITNTTLAASLNSPYQFVYGALNDIPTAFVTVGLNAGTSGQVDSIQ